MCPLSDRLLGLADSARQAGLAAEQGRDLANRVRITGHIGNINTEDFGLLSTDKFGFNPDMAKRGRKPKKPSTPMGSRIAAAREAAGLSQEALGEKLGLASGQSAVTRWETGDGIPSLPQFIQMGTVTGVPPWWLAFGIGPDGKPDQNDPFAVAAIERYKDHRLFAWAFTTAAKMMAEEGMDADMAMVSDYARKVLSLPNSGHDDAETREIVTRKIEKDRLEIRQGLEDLRKKFK